MSIERYRILIEQLCTELHLPQPGALYQAAVISAFDTRFQLFHGGVLAPDSVLLYCDVGQLPQQSPDLQQSREAVLLRLLALNGDLFSIHGAVFTCDQPSDTVALVGKLSLQRASLASTMALLAHFGELVQQWRRSYFLVPDEGRVV